MPKKPYTIVHDIPGRLRLRLPALRRGRTPESDIQALEGMNGMLFSRANPKCGALVLRYDPDRLDRSRILERLEDLFPTPERVPAVPACSASSRSCSCGDSRSVKRELGRFIGLSGVLGAVALRSMLFGITASQVLLSPVGLAALAFSLPLAKRGLCKLKEGRPGLDTFLAGGVLASLAGGQALTAMEILWVNSGADTLAVWIAERSRKHIADILEITSHHTFVLVDGVEVEREVADLEPGDVVVLHGGEKVSVDGEVVKGQALVNEAPISGREESVHKAEGDRVLAGTFVIEGVLRVRADKVGDETYLARVMHKVQESFEDRAPIEGVADCLADRVVKLGFLFTGGTLLLTGSLWRAYTVLLVMACPCATVLAASTAVSAAMNAAARNQVLIKGGRYLEEAGKCRTVLLDKTGTLTTTRPRLVRTYIPNGCDPEELLRLAVSTETHNHHPLARAVQAEARERGIEPVPHTECDYHMGMGMQALVRGEEVLVGNAKLAAKLGADISPLEEQAQALRGQGLIVLYVHLDKQPMGLLGFEAQTRPEARRTLRRLRELGVTRMELITGDEEASAGRLARSLDMDACHASVMPEEKAEIVSRVSEVHGPVLMVGDGINDALALARAEVGVAFGTAGSEVAVEAADIALVDDNLENLVALYSMSRKTIRVAHENFWIATGSNILGVVMGAAGILSPVTAGFLHIAHSLGVLANSSRLLRFPKQTVNPPRVLGEGNEFSDLGRLEEAPEHQASPAGPDPDQVRLGHCQ